MGSRGLFALLVAFMLLWLRVISLTIRLKQPSCTSIQDELIFQFKNQDALAFFLFQISNPLHLLRILDVEGEATKAPSLLPTPAAVVVLKQAYFEGFLRHMSMDRVARILAVLANSQDSQAASTLFHARRRLLLSDECLANWKGFWNLEPETLKPLLQILYPSEAPEVAFDSPLNHVCLGIHNDALENSDTLSRFLYTQEALLDRALEQQQDTGLMPLKAGWFTSMICDSTAINPSLPQKLISQYWMLIDTDNLKHEPKLVSTFLPSPFQEHALAGLNGYSAVALFVKWVLTQVLAVKPKDTPFVAFLDPATIADICTAWEKLYTTDSVAGTHDFTFLAQFLHAWIHPLHTRLNSLVSSTFQTEPDIYLHQAFFSGKVPIPPTNSVIESLKHFVQAFQAKYISDLCLIDVLDLAAFVANESPSVFLQRTAVIDLLAPLTLSPTGWSLLLKRGCAPNAGCSNNLATGSLPYYAESLGLGANVQSRNAYLGLVPLRTRHVNFVKQIFIAFDASIRRLPSTNNHIVSWARLLLNDDHARQLSPYRNFLAFDSFGIKLSDWQRCRQKTFNDFWAAWLRPAAGLLVTDSQSGMATPHFWMDPLIMLVLGRFFVYALLSGIRLEAVVDEAEQPPRFCGLDWEYFRAGWDANMDEHHLGLCFYKIYSFFDDCDARHASFPAAPPSQTALIDAAAATPESAVLRALTIQISRGRKSCIESRDAVGLFADSFWWLGTARLRDSPAAELPGTFETAAKSLSRLGLQYFTAALAPVRAHFTAREAYNALFALPAPI